MRSFFQFVFAHSRLGILLIGLVGLSLGVGILYSAVPSPDAPADMGVLKQQIIDYIGQTDKRLDESGARLTTLETKLSKIDADTAAIRAVQKMTLEQQDKIIYALWALIAGVLSLFGERVVGRIFERKRG